MKLKYISNYTKSLMTLGLKYYLPQFEADIFVNFIIFNFIRRHTNTESMKIVLQSPGSRRFPLKLSIEFYPARSYYWDAHRTRLQDCMNIMLTRLIVKKYYSPSSFLAFLSLVLVQLIVICFSSLVVIVCSHNNI